MLRTLIAQFYGLLKCAAVLFNIHMMMPQKLRAARRLLELWVFVVTLTLEPSPHPSPIAHELGFCSKATLAGVSIIFAVFH